MHYLKILAASCCHPEAASSRESHGDQELSRAQKVGRGICFSQIAGEKQIPRRPQGLLGMTHVRVCYRLGAVA
jgi:hypothetical protein